MATIELVYQIEDAFNLEIPDQDLAKLITVANVTAYIEGKVPPTRQVSAKPPSPRPKPKKKG
jgi:acyl carrier protein